MHGTRISNADHLALENLWDQGGIWASNTWTRLNTEHFGGKLKYHGIVWGLTPHGCRLGHTSPAGRITLHPALLNPRGNAWQISGKLGTLFAADVLLHEMCHVDLFAAGVSNDDEGRHHNTQEWADLIMRITPELGLWTVLAAPVKPRRIDGNVVRRPLDGHLSRDQMARWPYSLRLDGYYSTDPETIRVPI